MKPRYSFQLFILFLITLCVLAIVMSLGVGKYPLRALDVVQVVLAKFNGTAQPSALDTVVWQLRMPRILAALLVGGGLAVAGAAFQGMFRNPLVSPDILGVSSGAGLGAILAIFLQYSLVTVQLFAFVGGMFAVGLVYLLAQASQRHDPIFVLVLAGIALSTLLGAGISLLKILADPYTQLPTITFWLMGGLHGVTYTDLVYSAPLIVIGLVPMVLLSWKMNILSLSDQEAASLGVDYVRMRVLLIASATLMTASAVSFTGIIGWVGLVIPHVARLLVGPHFSRLIPTSLLLGALFLLITDTLARTIAPIELPLGILTAMIGAPFFMYLLMRGRT